MGLLISGPTAVKAVDFSGKTIEWIVPFKEGGGADTWAKFNAPFLSKHLPGSPEIIIKYAPGGSSTRAANNYALTAPKNGLQLFGTSGSTQFPFLLKDPRVIYDYKDWQVLLVYPSGGVVYTTSRFNITDASNISQLRYKKLIYGSQGTTSMDLLQLLGFELLGLDVTTIFGFRGRGAGRLAFERGQTNIDFQTSPSYIKTVKPLVESGVAIPLYSLGILDNDGVIIRDPSFPDLPTFKEVYESIHNKSPSGIEWESWFAFYSAGFGAQKLLVLPKDTPTEIINTYHKAIKAMLSDPDYLQQKDKVFGSYNQVGGETAIHLYKLSTHVPEKQKQWVLKWLRTKYKVKL